MRLFLSIEIPAEVKQAITPVYQLLPPSIKPTPLGQLHCTLCFIGEKQQEQLPGIISALSTVNFAPFTVTAANLDAFPSWSNPRTVWMGLESQELIRLANNISTELGIVEQLPFASHVTIARCKAPVNLANLGRYKSAVFGAFKVTGFDLKQSRLSISGASHSLIKRFPALSLS